MPGRPDLDGVVFIDDEARKRRQRAEGRARGQARAAQLIADLAAHRAAKTASRPVRCLACGATFTGTDAYLAHLEQPADPA